MKFVEKVMEMHLPLLLGRQVEPVADQELVEVVDQEVLEHYEHLLCGDIGSRLLLLRVRLGRQFFHDGRK